LDLIWFYGVDDRAFHHHRYWVHIPAFWAMIAVFVLPLLRVLKPTWLLVGMSFFTALLLHIILDSVGGDIMWLWPWRSDMFSLLTIPARFDVWILNFILHPVFLLEICIWAAFAWLYFVKVNEWPPQHND
jgi:inner membrane protein